MMKTTDKELLLLEEHEVKTDWREKAMWRKENRHWLRYSGRIAMKVLNRLDELGMTQKELSDRMGCSSQYVSKILKGYENLTLETISKLENALELDIVHSALSLVDGYECKDIPLRYVAEPEPPEYGKNL